MPICPLDSNLEKKIEVWIPPPLYSKISELQMENDLLKKALDKSVLLKEDKR